MSLSSVAPQPTRPVAMGVGGMVTSAHPLASLAGIGVLRDGGNAFDAAVATAATLNVVEPYMSGVGGIGLALVYVAAESRVRALNFSGNAPKAADPSMFTPEKKETGILSALVPGNVAGWMMLHDTYGSMERERLFQPAIGYAEDGFPITYLNSQIMAGAESRLRKYPGSASMILDDMGHAYKPGSKLKMPQLAGTLKQIAKHGRDVFYTGEIAKLIVQGSRDLGGLFTEDDFAEYTAYWDRPISIEYRGYEIYTTPPNSSGFQVLQTLKLMECFGEDEFVFQHPDTLHAQIEAIKLCVTDRIRYGGDPDYVRVPLSGLLSEAYAYKQRQRIDSGIAAPVSGERYTIGRPHGSIESGDLGDFDGGMTTHFAAADRDGNVVTVTQTLGGGFGSSVAVGDTGIFLNNMGSFFDLEEGSPNRIGSAKRVDFVVSPTQTLRDGRFFLSMGTPGGYGILQTTPQMLMNVIDYGLNVQQAIDVPRFKCVTGLEVQMEERFPRHVRLQLVARGHDVHVVDAWSPKVGGAQAIQINSEQGVFQGGADPRRDGYALGC